MAEISPFTDATGLLAELDAGRVSPTELVELYAGRIAEYNPKLNAIIIDTLDRARAGAEASASRREGAQPVGRLDGLPITLKESTQVAGLPQSAGIEMFAGFRPETDGLVADRFFVAGACLLGKTNIPAFLGDWQANSPVYGRTVNPWDETRTPGGSTGGGSAALAAGLTPLELGSDIGGSIRVPAAFCGLYGHRPSETVVPRSGSFPPSPQANPAFVMGVQGPLARSARDLELCLEAIAGPEIFEDAGAWKLHIPPARHESLGDFRVAILPRIPWLPLDPAIAAAIDRVASVCSMAGATVAEACPEGFQIDDFASTYVALLTIMTSQGMPDEERAAAARRAREGDNPFGQASARGLTASAPELMRILLERETYREMYARFFREWDILLCPIVITPAFEHRDEPFEQRTLTIDGQTVPYGVQSVYPSIATLPGFPATAFPAGKSGHLPIGLQAIGPYLEDRTPIRFAELLEPELGGFTPPPGY